MENKIIITPEESLRLISQFILDEDAHLADLRHSVRSPKDRVNAREHALTLAVARERERCASIVQTRLAQSEPWQDQDLLEDVLKKIRGAE